MYSLTGENVIEQNKNRKFYFYIKNRQIYIKMFVLKAKEIVELMLPAFETPTGLPYRFFNPKA
jgi:hypothetical protein